MMPIAGAISEPIGSAELKVPVAFLFENLVVN